MGGVEREMLEGWIAMKEQEGIRPRKFIIEYYGDLSGITTDAFG